MKGCRHITSTHVSCVHLLLMYLMALRNPIKTDDDDDERERWFASCSRTARARLIHRKDGHTHNSLCDSQLYLLAAPWRRLKGSPLKSPAPQPFSDQHLKTLYLANMSLIVGRTGAHQSIFENCGLIVSVLLRI